MAKISRQTTKAFVKKIRFKNGTLHKVIAYNEEGIQVGTGYFIHYLDDDSISEASLVDNNGDKLAEGWYQLKVMEGERYVVVPTRNQ